MRSECRDGQPCSSMAARLIGVCASTGPESSPACESPAPTPGSPVELTATSERKATPATTSTCIVTIDAGPAAGEVFALPPGRHLIGRSASCTIRLDDPLAELHHAALDVAAAETTIVQLAGRIPCWSELSGAPRQPAARTATTPGHAVVSIGASRLRLVAGTTPAIAAAPATLRPRRDDRWRVSLQRPPRQPTEFVAAPIDPPITQQPHPLRGAGGLLTGLLSVIGGVALAIVLSHPMYLIFSGIGFVTVVGSALGTRLGDRQRRRRQSAEAVISSRRAHRRASRF